MDPLSPNEPKVVLWDLETLPNLSEAMKVWTSLGNYPGLTLRASISSIICFGYKILGDPSAKIISAWNFSNWEKNVNDDSRLVAAAYEILKDADVIVTHNGKKFDFKFMQTRLAIHGLPPLPRVAHIDTCAEAKKNLFLFNNRLNTLGEQLVGEKKMEHEGWELWVKVLNRDPEAMKVMEAYCIQDVALLEKVFKKIRPMVQGLPNRNLISQGKQNVCPVCESTRLRSLGKRFTVTRAYRRYLCLDCGAHSRTDAADNMPRTF